MHKSSKLFLTHGGIRITLVWISLVYLWYFVPSRLIKKRKDLGYIRKNKKQ